MIPIPLAELPAPDSPASVGWIVLTFFAIMGGLYYTIVVFEKLRGKKPVQTEITGGPVEFKQFTGVVTRKEWEETHGRISRERREIDTEIKRVEAVAEKRADKVEKKIDENTAMTSEMKGQVGQMNQSMGKLSDSLTNFMRDQANKKTT